MTAQQKIPDLSPPSILVVEVEITSEKYENMILSFFFSHIFS